MTLAITGLPKTTTHGAPQLPGQLRNKGLAALGGKVRSPVATRSSLHPLAIRCSTDPIHGVNAAVHKKVDVKPVVILGRSSFPPGFVFGAGSSAYQVEGDVEGRGTNIWDTFCRDFPEKIADKSNGDIANEAHRYIKEDVKILKDMGVDSYRFSISWARILPKGSLKGGVNKKGIQYYNDIINELLKNGIKPLVTLFHWDVPQTLEDEYGGFLDRKIIDDFKDYCEICYKEFGDRIKYWVTMNEQYVFSTFGYDKGVHAPGRCSPSLGVSCPVGNSATEPYIVAHNLILAHATAARLYKEKFQDTQKGQVGVTLMTYWYIPYDENVYEDHEAQTRALDFNFGWFMDPLMNGDYPFNMRALVRERLPYFSSEESKMIKGSFDFIGLNYYTARYAKGLPIPENDSPISSLLDSYVDSPGNKNGIPIGDEQIAWINVYPDGLKDLLQYIKRRYRNPPIYVTENGVLELNNPDLPLEQRLTDTVREGYLAGHLKAVKEAIRYVMRVRNVKGYFVWSFSDDFEWDSGYTMRFGLIYIDYEDNLKRRPKKSSKWFTKFLSS